MEYNGTVYELGLTLSLFVLYYCVNVKVKSYVEC